MFSPADLRPVLKLVSIRIFRGQAISSYEATPLPFSSPPRIRRQRKRRLMAGDMRRGRLDREVRPHRWEVLLRTAVPAAIASRNTGAVRHSEAILPGVAENLR